jgi:pimeloyl-ACP methyl ester carboxylesterase
VAPIQHVKSADGTRIGYRADGSGEPILFVHGSCTSGGDWAFVRPLLSERFTVVTMDRRGRGESADGPEYAMGREAEDLLAVLEAVEATKLVAHSYGALCATLAVNGTQHLERLVLYEPPIAVRGERVPGIDSLVAAGDLDTAVERFLQAAAVPEQQLAAIRSSPAWPVLVEAVPVLPREQRAAAEWRPPRGPIDVPLLYLIGGETEAPVYLDGVDALLAAFPDHRREVIPGQTHIGHVFAAEAVAELVADFCG